ncbi:MAG TPA: adenosylcobinamide-GDP ribazoletransferase [Kineosporiaceae bacterium]
MTRSLIDTRGPAWDTLVDGLRLGVGTLTALPVPPPRRVARTTAAVAMLLAPLVGLIPGAAAAAVAWAGTALGGSAPLCAGLAVGLVALLTRGLHLDGLADTADGLASAYDRDRALAVMRRGDTGPSGAATLVLVLLVQVTALAQALDRLGPAAALAGVVAGRAALPVVCARGIPAARPDGLGATVAGTVPRQAAALVAGLTAVGCAALVHRPGAVVAALTGLAAAGVLLARTTRRLGGVTGDVLGACVEAATTGTLVVLAVVPA